MCLTSEIVQTDVVRRDVPVLSDLQSRDLGNARGSVRCHLGLVVDLRDALGLRFRLLAQRRKLNRQSGLLQIHDHQVLSCV